MKRILNFLKFRYIAFGLSAFLIVLFSAGTVMKGGMNMGIDFVGGVKLIAHFPVEVSENDIRNSFEDFEFSPSIQQIGEKSEHEFIISTKLSGEETSHSLQEVKKILQDKYPEISFLSEENVGPAIGDLLKESALKLFLVAMLMMTIYLTFRFELKYGIAAMIALLHDVLLCFLLVGFTGMEMNIPVVAAILTVFGYSINDTIVVFDRIRENTKGQTNLNFIEIINKSITQSISRTLITSLTTMFAVAALFVMGGKVLHDFAAVLLFGIIIGTYSTMYLASPFLLILEKIKNRKKAA